MKTTFLFPIHFVHRLPFQKRDKREQTENGVTLAFFSPDNRNEQLDNCCCFKGRERERKKRQEKQRWNNNNNKKKRANTHAPRCCALFNCVTNDVTVLGKILHYQTRIPSFFSFFLLGPAPYHHFPIHFLNSKKRRQIWNNKILYSFTVVVIVPRIAQ